jgi:hypothetical protein
MVLVEASLSYATGAGGLSISPRLNFAVTLKISPAQHLIVDIWHPQRPYRPDYSEQDAVKAIESIERKLVLLYQSGQASPYERDEHGSNHLHVSHICYIPACFRFDSDIRLTWTESSLPISRP